MSANVSFERRLAAWMADEAAMGESVGAIDEVLTVTSGHRPHPRWLALLRETPMRTQGRVLVGSPTRRLALTLAATFLLIIAAVVVGSQLLTRAATDDWPMFRGGPDRSGAGLQGPAGRPVLDWQLRLDGIPGNVSIVGDAAYVATDVGTLTAINLESGAARWTFAPDRGPLVGPTVVDGLAYVSDEDGTILAIDVASREQRWASADTYQEPSTVTVGAGRVYFGTFGGELVALDAKSGAEAWRASIPGGGGVHNPAFADGAVFASSDSAGFVAVDAGTGAIRWQLELDGDVPGTAVVADGVAFVGLGGGTDVGSLRAIDVASGELRWETDEAFQAPAVTDGVAYTTDNTGLAAALRVEDGTEI